jgi:hypothetical protein
VNAPSCDGITAYFSDDYNDGIDNKDVIKYGNLDETLSWKKQDKFLVKEMRSMPLTDDVMPLTLSQYRDKTYTFSIDYNGDLNIKVYLFDRYLNQNHRLVQGTNTVHFDLNDEASKKSDRFEIRFESESSSIKNIIYSHLTLKNNPIKDGILHLECSNTRKSVNHIRLIDMQGRIVWAVQPTQVTHTLEYSLPKQLSAAVYTLQITGNGFTQNQKVVLE